MKTKIYFFVLLILSIVGCSNPKSETNLEANYYTFDLVEFAGMIGKPYDATVESLTDYEVDEEVLAGIRINTYSSLKDGENNLEFQLQESSDNKVYEIYVRASSLEYSEKEQFNMFVEYVKKADSKFSFIEANYRDDTHYDETEFHNVESADKMIKLIQNNPRMYSNNSFMVQFKSDETEVSVSYLKTMFIINFN